jgi:hypothetical protein
LDELRTDEDELRPVREIPPVAVTATMQSEAARVMEDLLGRS